MAAVPTFLRPCLGQGPAPRSRLSISYTHFYNAVRGTALKNVSSKPTACAWSRNPPLSALVQSNTFSTYLWTRSSASDREEADEKVDSAQNVISGNLSGGARSLHEVAANKKTKSPALNTQQAVSATPVPERLWPRMPKQRNALYLKDFRSKYQDLAAAQTVEDVEVTVRGRIQSKRLAGKGLIFLDLIQDRTSVQCLLSEKTIKKLVPQSQLSSFMKDIHRGDIISVTGNPCRTDRHELSVRATSLPVQLSKCSSSIPASIENQETKMQNRIVDFLIDPEGPDRLRFRAEILKVLRAYFERQLFVDVQTPILSDQAGGATARPFSTFAADLGSRKLSLRIAPELWLKKLIISGLDRIYEIGPSFRNEGIDSHHNPEFWTCEFYKTYADLDELIDMTEDLFRWLSTMAQKITHARLRSLQFSEVGFKSPYQRIDFISALERALGAKLPPLHSESAKSLLLDVLQQKGVEIDPTQTLPQLLNRLSSNYLENQTLEPRWIVNHPECLSPLSKSFTHPENGQRVAARAELFVGGYELVNCYEEENSPIEQRRKFEMQRGFSTSSEPPQLDESYLEALQWGLPPTGGWGCGIERLVMLFSCTDRIADTLAFGNLRNVVSKNQDLRNVISRSQDRENVG